jgi:hypothetical protein
MPVYFFTLHAYRSWNADHRRGYVRRGQGILPPDLDMAREYDQRATQDPTRLDTKIQQIIIESAREASAFQGYRFFETTHVHLLVSWSIQRGWLAVRTGLRQSLTRKLNAQIERREWFASAGSRRRVMNRRHFQHLITTYRRKHQGLHWVESAQPPADSRRSGVP